MEEFKNILTDGEKQRKLIMHCVENTRRFYPGFRKLTVKKYLGTIIITHCAGNITADKLSSSNIENRNLNYERHLDLAFWL